MMNAGTWLRACLHCWMMIGNQADKSGSEKEGYMTLKDASNGPVWTLWIVAALFAIISIFLLTGHGANLIAGYNTASEKEKSKIDEKKLCRVVGGGLSVITLFLFIMVIGASVLPASFSKVFLTITLIDCAVIILLANTICKK